MVGPFSWGGGGGWLSPVRGRGMCCTVCGMVHIKDILLLIGNSSPYIAEW